MRQECSNTNDTSYPGSAGGTKSASAAPLLAGFSRKYKTATVKATIPAAIGKETGSFSKSIGRVEKQFPQATPDHYHNVAVCSSVLVAATGGSVTGDKCDLKRICLDLSALALQLHYPPTAWYNTAVKTVGLPRMMLLVALKIICCDSALAQRVSLDLEPGVVVCPSVVLK